MIIRDLEFYLVAMPSTANTQEANSLIVRLISHVGVEGWGEAVGVNLTWDNLPPLRERLLTVLMGRSVFDLEELVRLSLFGVKPIRFAIETACWDMMGRLCKQPICHFLGGKYRPHVPMTVSLAGRSPKVLISMSQELANRGHHWQMLSLTGRLDDDLQLIKSLQEAVKHRVELRVDACGRYGRDDCVKLLTAIEKSGIALLIDPLQDATPQELSAMQKQTPIPLGVRQGIDSVRDVLDLATVDNLSWLILEPQRLGSLLEMRKCADIAEAAGLHCSICSCCSRGPATAAMMQLAAAMPALSHGIHCFSDHLETNILHDAFDMSDGLLHLPHGPGIGREIDRAKLERALTA